MSEDGAGANVRSAFKAHNISSSEHMPLTFAITRSNETGAIEIVCSGPEGRRVSGFGKPPKADMK